MERSGWTPFEGTIQEDSEDNHDDLNQNTRKLFFQILTSLSHVPRHIW
jgi:hypothetical protein